MLALAPLCDHARACGSPASRSGDEWRVRQPPGLGAQKFEHGLLEEYSATLLLSMRRIKGRGAGEWNGNRYLNSVNYCPSVSDPAHARQITGYLSKLER